LINPGRPAYQLLGVFSLDLVEPVATALNALGLKRGLVVHTELESGKGMDELACCGTCHVAGFGEFEGMRDTWTPDIIGLDRCSLDDVRGGDLECNVRILECRGSLMDCGAGDRSKGRDCPSAWSPG
jgi:anthranilate phosphoribosyltransferase